MQRDVYQPGLCTSRKGVNTEGGGGVVFCPTKVRRKIKQNEGEEKEIGSTCFLSFLHQGDGCPDGVTGGVCREQYVECRIDS